LLTWCFAASCCSSEHQGPAPTSSQALRSAAVGGQAAGFKVEGYPAGSSTWVKVMLTTGMGGATTMLDAVREVQLHCSLPPNSSVIRADWYTFAPVIGPNGEPVLALALLEEVADGTLLQELQKLTPEVGMADTWSAHQPSSSSIIIIFI
jgi:hypothetical protein